MSVESEVSDMTAFAQSVPSFVIGESIEAFGQRILAALYAERKEFRRKEVELERRIKLAGSMAKAKAKEKENGNVN